MKKIFEDGDESIPLLLNQKMVQKKEDTDTPKIEIVEKISAKKLNNKKRTALYAIIALLTFIFMSSTFYFFAEDWGLIDSIFFSLMVKKISKKKKNFKKKKKFQKKKKKNFKKISKNFLDAFDYWLWRFNTYHRVY